MLGHLPLNLTAVQLAFIGAWLLLTAILCINPPWPLDLALNHSLTVVALITVLHCNRRQRWSTPALVLIVAFLTLHSIGARWLYSNVPYDQWTYSLLGWKLSTLMDWQRNHWDRLVHFSYGLLLTFPLFERLRRHFSVRVSNWIAVELIASSSMMYELLEWGVALVLDPVHAEAYNGQQGDMFDAQKDMALAFLGALIAACMIACISFRTHKTASN